MEIKSQKEMENQTESTNTEMVSLNAENETALSQDENGSKKTSNLRLKKTGACLILPLPHLRMGMLQAKKIKKLHKKVCHCSMTTWMKTFRNGRAIFDGSNTFKYSGIIA